MIALLGATGYTGKLVAAELTRKGVAHRLGARSPEKLAQVPSDAERFNSAATACTLSRSPYSEKISRTTSASAAWITSRPPSGATS